VSSFHTAVAMGVVSVLEVMLEVSMVSVVLLIAAVLVLHIVCIHLCVVPVGCEEHHSVVRQQWKDDTLSKSSRGWIDDWISHAIDRIESCN
jgi:hypothetical protein